MYVYSFQRCTVSTFQTRVATRNYHGVIAEEWSDTSFVECRLHNQSRILASAWPSVLMFNSRVWSGWDPYIWSCQNSTNVYTCKLSVWFGAICRYRENLEMWQNYKLWIFSFIIPFFKHENLRVHACMYVLVVKFTASKINA